MILHQAWGPPPEDVHEALKAIYAVCFDGRPEMVDELARRQDNRVWWATVDGDVVGFKWGVLKRAGHLHSHAGGVLPAQRGKGVARALLRAQHSWAAENGVRVVSTNTFDDPFLPMLLLNLQEGFDVMGVSHTHRGLKLHLERRLPSDATLGEPGPLATTSETVIPSTNRARLAAHLGHGFRVKGVFLEDGQLLVQLTRPSSVVPTR